MGTFGLGQRWMSEAEPELGLGTIVEVSAKTLSLEFPIADTQRTYGVKTAPLKRVVFSVDDEITSRDGRAVIVREVEEKDFLLMYHGDDVSILETELSDDLSFSKPQERLFSGLVDSNSLYDLRVKSLEYLQKVLSSPARGLLGGRLSLLPHQYYVASKILESPVPRVLLADEVGLGKTIEAGLVLHNLIVNDRVKRALILVPDSLMFQWFLEMRRKFNLAFSVINQDTHLEVGTNPFADQEFVIVNMGLLKGAEMARELLFKTNWDMVIVDEAHRLEWSEEAPSKEYQIVSQLSKQTHGMLLLTATPEQLGVESHFSRLQLLDSKRFSSLDKYKEERKSYQKTANTIEKLNQGIELSAQERELFPTHITSKDEKVEYLLDRYGTSRSYFRNTRSTLEKFSSFFPKRILNTYNLEGSAGDEFELKALWLVNFLRSQLEEKTLLIVKDKRTVLELEKYIRETSSVIKTGLFHSDLSLMARDRQSAYFSEEDGCHILLCTEIGSEGRNFEFAKNLVLFDIPANPDLLEQRIGRLDRIGQKNDIQIQVPIVKGTNSETLFKWMHEGLNAFEKSSACGRETFLEFKDDILDCLENPSEIKLEELIAKTKVKAKEIEAYLEAGRDILVEQNSFNEKEAKALISEVKEYDNSDELHKFMDLIFHHLGVDVEELDDESFFIKPNTNMFIPSFPYLSSEGKRITYIRQKALEREDLDFLTWDHPMVTSIIDLISSEKLGNMTLSQRKESKSNKIFIECQFLLECLGPAKLEVRKYFPPTLVRVLVNAQGEDFTEKWGYEFLNTKVVNASKESRERTKNIPKDKFNAVIKQAETIALAKTKAIHDKALAYMQNTLNNEILRYEELAKNTETDELATLKNQLFQLSEAALKPRVSLDSLRVIL
jgi:ATP-dependent helicase HepA